MLCRPREVSIFPQGQQSERNASKRENHPTRARRDAAGREKNEGPQTKPKLFTLLLKESHWMRFIDLKGDTNFTLQNQSAVRGQKLRFCLKSLIFLSPRRVSNFSRGVIFTRARVSLALLSLRKNGDYSQSKCYEKPYQPLNRMVYVSKYSRLSQFTRCSYSYSISKETLFFVFDGFVKKLLFFRKLLTTFGGLLCSVCTL